MLAELTQRKVLAIIRADGPDRALECIRALVAAGITIVEVSLTTPGGAEAIARARTEFDASVLIGAGTVVSEAQADEVAAARADFVVTPAITRGAHHSVELGLPLLCGALTPTEIISALDLGAMAVKIFPAKLHGPGYFRELRAPLPDAPLIAVGGVDVTTAPQYLQSGALAVGLGSPLLGDAGTGGSQSELASRAAAFLRAVADA
ncbi:bifunctional 4-hydroxy-2-oxoglutarate aldolase/2-dehydro-3-deoxy-phosphogluconate aldolase [Kribbella sp. CA-293567]|uniref:bifunctional 4-hydroxy-2-oxoglutarate aldolase/2-dehydro-3-deoxy-phosphogluconate aldolase n=1 Tax=Kribbella sp. CA-293567 TaxID=3002436 RepID=UPI0022DE67A5|nr:bifunctional 4-hydroxy-2-oxoglutarate aldolase/2-dehydro-3-deoxy-phosphogluconate aldolase [Kribbella sp. CA-293567]WBQ08605.1 bifunctional 4-hydroxy-2-oxoglutarate aldolase/2-dehydro-3-deoxy-phosphogluconate aldolase [Kribbella sp. CA-293567]